MLRRANVDENDVVLVTGASGGVGSALIQLAKRRGARVVALASEAKHDEVAKLNPDAILPRAPENLAKALKESIGQATVSVVADIVDITRALTSDPENRVPHLAFQADSLSDVPVLPVESIHTAYYLRLTALDQPGVLANITQILGDGNISIEAFIQRQAGKQSDSDVTDTATIILLTKVVNEGEMNQAIAKIEALSVVTGEVTRIRVESLS